MGFFGRSKKKATPEAPPSPPQRPLQKSRPGENKLYESPVPRQPPGYLLPPPPTRPSPPGVCLPPYHDQRPYPIVVNQHYYLSAPPSHPLPPNPYLPGNGPPLPGSIKIGSAVNLANGLTPLNVAPMPLDDGLPRWHAYGTQLLNQTAALYDQIYSNFNNVMTLIDRDKYVGNEADLFMYQPQPAAPPPNETLEQTAVSRKTPVRKGKKEKERSSKGQNAITSSLASRGYFAKVELYTNAKLPLDLPPLRLYFTTYPLICLAAQYAERVYENPRGAERDAHIDADWKTGAKAMRIKSVPMDHMDTIVFAVRGTATFMDWAVNLNTAPAAPAGFLDDEKNFCHAGFLSVARKMIAPVASRLRYLLEENPRRCSYSLLITGHSAGGAVASLLYAHMLASSKGASSELNNLTGCFKRVHCITFGAPPVSLLPLQKPNKPELRKAVFLSFVNEGDPVARADKAYVKSLLELLVAPPPTEAKGLRKEPTTSKTPYSKHGKSHAKRSSTISVASKTSKAPAKTSRSSHSLTRAGKPKPSGPVWKVPQSTLSNAGQIVVLRSRDSNTNIKRERSVEERLKEGVSARVATDEQLRGQIWGDPVCHVMKLYAGRVEQLAVDAVTARGR
ncbi:alpha/beta-hydrolase [Durotheca rogersii]|uniref:alpha/beta-hydrolase n=1 Tax=Durotheca rogersii TaxID=419775 RepID=UPI0022203D3D|nr:alpha/beta-hydrolase [Durotheca rogersii]KAI5865323.1 alpha/beta-hydrolase [Durotheca rogersii]